MACGSRPVEGSPQRGVFPTVGIRQRPGVKGAGPFAPLPPPPTAGWQIAIADQGGTGQVGRGPEPSGATGASRIEIRDLSVVQNTTLAYTQHSTASLFGDYLIRRQSMPGGAG
jgi:hypothetical protein